MSDAMKTLSKDDILAAHDYQVKEVEVPEWKGTVRLKSLNGLERDKFETQCVKQSTGNNSVDITGLKVLLLSLTIVDDADALMFTKKDVAALNEKSAAAINRVYMVAQKMNGLGEDEVEELVKNSEGSQKESSGSDSQPISEEGQ